MIAICTVPFALTSHPELVLALFHVILDVLPELFCWHAGRYRVHRWLRWTSYIAEGCICLVLSGFFLFLSLRLETFALEKIHPCELRKMSMHILIAISQRLFFARSPLYNVYFTHVPHFLGKGVHVANMRRQHPNRHVPIKDSNAPD